MKRLKFDSQGKLMAVDGGNVGYSNGFESEENGNGSSSTGSGRELKRSENLEFLREEKKIENIFDREFWSLYSNDKPLAPLKFSNGKSQEDIVRDVVDLIRNGNRIIFIHGVCGTGKSAIALNIARVLGKASIVVPIKGLQRQYEEDYMGKKFLTKNGKKMKIAMITGRDNHDSIIEPGKSCADPFLPDTIQLIEKNIEMIQKFYDENPLIRTKSGFDIKKMKRIAIAPANPYWSPILPADFDAHLSDAQKKKYKGLQGKDFIFYHRKKGCSYFDQYQAYIDADVIIFNSAKYKIELALDRKPETDVEIIDEADEFLDNFSNQQEINLTRAYNALKNVFPDNNKTREAIEAIMEYIKLEEKNKRALGIDENKVFKLSETKVSDILRTIVKNPEVEAEFSMDELNYGNKLVEVADAFKLFFDDTYLTFRRFGEDLYANLVTTNLSKRFHEMIEKNKAVVLMSGTLHSDSVLKNVFGIENYKIVEAETVHQGMIEIERTGKEIDCRYSNFTSKKHSRKDYLIALEAAIAKAKKPILVHVNAYDDLPSEFEKQDFSLKDVMSKEKLLSLQGEDKTGRMISLFKSKLSDSLFTTRCSRGVDFPGDTCNSVIFTKYPNPNINGTFWKILEKTHPNDYWNFYRDKARREFLQKIYRAIRSEDDHVYVLSPDMRVIDAVRDMQLNNLK